MARSLLIVGMLVPLVLLTGCGPRLVPVAGIVTLDGKPVEGATVTFTSTDGKYTSTALTDDGGNFTLATQAGPGAYPGDYKVTVAKYPKIDTPVDPTEITSGGGKDYSKQMKKEVEAGKEAGMPKTMPKMGGGSMPPGKMPPGKMMIPGGGVSQSGAKSELPEVYAALDKTPFQFKVPAESSPLKLELKSKP